MKVHLERAGVPHVQTFAPACPEEGEVATLLGWPGVEEMYLDLVERSSQAFALVIDHIHACDEPGLDRVIALAGVLRKPGGDKGPSLLWLHTSSTFKRAGFGALRVARLLVDRLVGECGELIIDVPASNADLVRMADWLGFRTRGTVEKFGRTYHHAFLRRSA